jgi:hypothetical protein
MDHVYERQFAVCSGNELEIPTGVTSMCWAIDYPHAASITKLIVKQYSGASVAYSVNIYNRPVCNFAADGSSSMGSECTPEVAKVIPTQSEGAGHTLELFETSGYVFRNMEGTFSVPVRKLYLEIVRASAADDSLWEVAIGSRPEI